MRLLLIINNNKLSAALSIYSGIVLRVGIKLQLISGRTHNSNGIYQTRDYNLLNGTHDIFSTVNILQPFLYVCTHAYDNENFIKLIALSKMFIWASLIRI